MNRQVVSPTLPLRQPVLVRICATQEIHLGESVLDRVLDTGGDHHRAEAEVGKLRVVAQLVIDTTAAYPKAEKTASSLPSARIATSQRRPAS